MNKFEFFQNVQLADDGSVEVVTVSGMTDSTITTPGSEKEFYEQIQLDENGAVKIYIKSGSEPTPTPTPTVSPTPTPTSTPTPTPTSTATPTPTPITPVAFDFAKELLFADCSVLSPDATYYTAGVPILADGVTLYTDNTLTTPVNGGSGLYYAYFVGSTPFSTMEISSVGIISNYTNCPTPTPTPTVSPTPTPTPTPSPTPTGDTDATAYLAAVVAAGGTVDATMSAATNTLFTDLKSNGLYSKLVAMYPFLGGTQNSCKFNALNPLDTNAAFRLSYIGSGLSFSSSGMSVTNQTSAANTNLVATNVFTGNSQTTGIYFTALPAVLTRNVFLYGAYRDDVVPAGEFFQSVESTGGELTSVYYSRTNDLSWGAINDGLLTQSTDGSTIFIRRNGAAVSSTSLVGNICQYPIYIGALNILNTAPPYFGEPTAVYSFFYESQYLNSSECGVIETLINTFQTTLGRNTY